MTIGSVVQSDIDHQVGPTIRCAHPKNDVDLINALYIIYIIYKILQWVGSPNKNWGGRLIVRERERDLNRLLQK